MRRQLKSLFANEALKTWKQVELIYSVKQSMVVSSKARKFYLAKQLSSA